MSARKLLDPVDAPALSEDLVTLIDTGSRMSLFAGYLLGAGLMLAASVIAARYGVAAEGKSLEDVAKPLSAAH